MSSRSSTGRWERRCRILTPTARPGRLAGPGQRTAPAAEHAALSARARSLVGGSPEFRDPEALDSPPSSAAEGWRASDQARAPASRSLRCSRARLVGSRAGGAEARAGVRARPPPATARRTAARRSAPRKHDAQGVDIRARGDRLSGDLLRAGVLGRPEDRPSVVAPTSLAARAIPKSATRASPASPIRIFAGLMSRWTMPCSWANWRARAVSMPIRTAKPIASAPSRAMTSSEIRAVDEAHHDEIATRLVDTGVVDRDDVRVEQGRSIPRLPTKARHERVILGERRSQHLDRDVAGQHLVPSAIHDRHAALADDLEQAIAAGEHTSRHRHRPIQGQRASQRGFIRAPSVTTGLHRR